MNRVALLVAVVCVVIVASQPLHGQPATQPAPGGARAATRPANARTTTAPAGPVVSKPPPALPNTDGPRWTVLFDGKSLDGWVYNPDSWTIVDGAMRGTGKGGNIFTKGDYGNFRLLITSRVASPEGDDGHNHLGVLFWGDRPADGKFGTSGALQVQPPHGAMWDYHKGKGNIKVERAADFVRPRYQDWHVCEIIARLDTGEVKMANDGVPVMTYKYPDLAALKKGPIGMQIHAATGIFEYKDIKIEVDPKDDKFVTVKP